MKWRDSKKNYSENRIFQTAPADCNGIYSVRCNTAKVLPWTFKSLMRRFTKQKLYRNNRDSISLICRICAVMGHSQKYYTEIARKRAKFKGAIMPERSFLMSNYYFNLLSQAQKLYRHNRQGSYNTIERYFAA